MPIIGTNPYTYSKRQTDDQSDTDNPNDCCFGTAA